MSILKSPYNFVPLPEKVFFPEWADKISQDAPFSDGISGYLELKLTAKSPIFVRNGHTKAEADELDPNYLSFSKTPDGNYFIPGTSMKGVFRSVFEIITASKVGIFQNRRFSIRDLSRGADGIFYREKISSGNIRCGWMRMDDSGKFIIKDCGIPWRISAEEVDNILHIGLDKFVKNGKFNNDANRTAKTKYDKAGKKINEVYTFIEDTRTKAAMLANNRHDSRHFVKQGANGVPGKIVFTGQPGNRERNADGKWKGKYFEFVFPETDEVTSRMVRDSVVEEFKAIHENSPDYKDFRKPQLLRGNEIPVFFMLDSEGSVDSIGLSYMFKYPTYNDILSSLREDDWKTEMDMTECVFGTTKLSALKGRVQFGHAMSDGDIRQLNRERLILSSPHPSYYPLYLNNGKTWNSEEVEVSGQKRYPVRSTLMPSTIGTDDMYSKFIPVGENAVFTEKVYFHNLRKSELGALISAITFCGEKDCCHSVGSGKPYGYGRLAVEIIGKSDTFDTKECVEAFDNIISKYKDASTLKELFAMAKGIPAGRESEFTYMNMSTNRNENEFLEGKNEVSRGKQLGKFTEIINGTVPRTNLAGNVSANKHRISIADRIKANDLYCKCKDTIEKGDIETAENLLNDLEECKCERSKIIEIQGLIKTIKDANKAKEIEKLYRQCKEEIEKGNIEAAERQLELLKGSEYEQELRESVIKHIRAEAEKYEQEAELIKGIECNPILDKAEECYLKLRDKYHQSVSNDLARIEKLRYPDSNPFDSVFTLNSVAAFANNQINKYIKYKRGVGNIGESELNEIADAIKNALPTLKGDAKRSWPKYKSWAPIEKILGKDSTLKIFERVYPNNQ